MGFSHGSKDDLRALVPSPSDKKVACLKPTYTCSLRLKHKRTVQLT